MLSPHHVTALSVDQMPSIDPDRPASSPSAGVSALDQLAHVYRWLEPLVHENSQSWLDGLPEGR